MQYDINRFAGDFRDTVDWMLAGKYGDVVKGDLQLLKDRKKELETKPDSLEALALLAELIVTNAWYYKKPERLDSEFGSLIERHGRNIRTEVAINELAMFDISTHVAPNPAFHAGADYWIVREPFYLHNSASTFSISPSCRTQVCASQETQS